MSNPVNGCFDLSTIEGVRVFGFAVAEAAKRLSGQNIAEAKEFKAASDRIANLVIELGGDRSEKDLALKAQVTDFNFRDPRFFGYLEKNDLLFASLLDLSNKNSFKIRRNFTPDRVRKTMEKLPLSEIQVVFMISEVVQVAEHRLSQALQSLLDIPVECESVVNQLKFEIIFSKPIRGSKRVFDYREEAAIKALRLFRKRNLHKDDPSYKPRGEFDLRNCVREVLNSGEFTIASLDAQPKINQIKIGPRTDIETATTAVEIVASRFLKR